MDTFAFFGLDDLYSPEINGTVHSTDLMMMDILTIPLFPLNVVLFPEGRLPLHIFEDRYKLMVQRCIDSDSIFGVVLIKSGSEVGETAEPHCVGTLSEITDMERLDDDRFLITILGRQRFRITKTNDEDPYLKGQVNLLEDNPNEEIPPEFIRRIREATAHQIRLLLGLRGGWVGHAKIPEDPTKLSYFIARIIRTDLNQKQSLLEMDIFQRLESELEILESQSKSLQNQTSNSLLKRISLN